MHSENDVVSESLHEVARIRASHFATNDLTRDLRLLCTSIRSCGVLAAASTTIENMSSESSCGSQQVPPVVDVAVDVCTAHLEPPPRLSHVA